MQNYGSYGLNMGLQSIIKEEIGTIRKKSLKVHISTLEAMVTKEAAMKNYDYMMTQMS